jgi:hypothetical protein
MLTEREITLCRVALLVSKPSDEKRALLIKLGAMRDAMAPRPAFPGWRNMTGVQRRNAKMHAMFERARMQGHTGFTPEPDSPRS